MNEEQKTRRIDKIVSNITDVIKCHEFERVDLENKMSIIEEKISLLQRTLKNIIDIAKDSDYID